MRKQDTTELRNAIYNFAADFFENSGVQPGNYLDSGYLQLSYMSEELGKAVRDALKETAELIDDEYELGDYNKTKRDLIRVFLDSI